MNKIVVNALCLRVFLIINDLDNTENPGGKRIFIRVFAATNQFMKIRVISGQTLFRANSFIIS